MRQTHEEEVNSMIGENEKLQGLVDISRRKINELDSEIEQLKEALNQSKTVLWNFLDMSNMAWNFRIWNCYIWTLNMLKYLVIWIYIFYNTNIQIL